MKLIDRVLLERAQEQSDQVARETVDKPVVFDKDSLPKCPHGHVKEGRRPERLWKTHGMFYCKVCNKIRHDKEVKR